MDKKSPKSKIAENIKAIDDIHSKRFISLDPNGYFLIKVDYSSKELIAEHYSNNVNEKGIATDPSTGKPLGCNDTKHRTPLKIYKGKTAKELGMKISEEGTLLPISRLDHALYLGRELQKAELCLINGAIYIQD